MDTIALLLKQLVEFESPRCLIQEVTSSADHNQDLFAKSKEETYLDGAEDFVAQYLSRSIVLFKDDEKFMQELESLLSGDLPVALQSHLLSVYLDELDQVMTSDKETSQSMQ